MSERLVEHVMLTVEDIETIMEIIGREVIVTPTDQFPFWVTRRVGHGYMEDPKLGRIQAKLSIYLEVAAGLGRRNPR